MGKTIAISNQKGGVGKTTTSVNLASSLSALGKKILLIDLDPQGSTTVSLGINRGHLKYSVYDLFINKKQIKEIIVKPEHVNIDVVPTTVDLAGVEVKLVEDIFKNYILEKEINRVKDEYDYVIIDTPPSLGLLSLNALFAANSIIIPVQCQFLAIDGLTQLLNTIRIVQKQKKINRKILSIEGVLLTMLDKRTKTGKEIVEEVKQYFGEKVFNTIIYSNVAAQVAPSYGMPLLKYAPKSSSAIQYKELAEELISKNV